MNEIFIIIQNAMKIMEEAEEHYATQYRKVLPKVIEGIQNYMRTYKDDAFITSRCNVLLERIRYVMSKSKSKEN